MAFRDLTGTLQGGIIKMEHEMDIFKINKTTWRIQTDKDAIVIMLEHGEVNFYRQDDSIADISDDKD